MDIERLRELANVNSAESGQYYFDNIETATVDNGSYRRVVFTGPSIQLVLMSIPPGEEIGEEVHEKVDQFIRIEAGTGKFVIAGEERTAKDGDAVVVPRGISHNLINVGDTDLKVYAIYSPPEHESGLEQKSKE